jgi:hypothetical protein
LPGLEEATRTHTFELGRGGCRFLCPQPLTVERTIDLSIRFVKEELSLHVRGTVRWHDSSDWHAG